MSHTPPIPPYRWNGRKGVGSALPFQRKRRGRRTGVVVMTSRVRMVHTLSQRGSCLMLRRPDVSPAEQRRRRYRARRAAGVAVYPVPLGAAEVEFLVRL